MATATTPAVHWFVPREPGSAFAGPPAETCHFCGCDPSNVIHWSVPREMERLEAAAALPLALPVFTSHIPGGTSCELCGRLRHFHCDDHCVSKPVRSRAKPDDESTGAQRDVALASVLALARVIRKVGGYLTVEDQDALRQAESLLAGVSK